MAGVSETDNLWSKADLFTLKVVLEHRLIHGKEFGREMCECNRGFRMDNDDPLQCLGNNGGVQI